MSNGTIQRALHLKRPGTLERFAAVIIALIFSISLPTEWFIIRSDAEASGGALVQLTFLSFLGVAILGINGNWGLFKEILSREPLLTALLGLTMLSTVWSENPALTFNAVIVLWITCVIAVYLMLRFSIAEILYLFGVGLAIALMINFVMVFVFPASGTQNVGGVDGAWTGVFRSRNSLGRLAVLSAVIFAFNVRARRSFFVWPLLTAMAAVQVIGTASATSLGSLMAITTLIITFLGFRGRKYLYGATAVAMITVFGIVIGAAAVNLTAATALVGREATFTGRLPLWQDSFEYGIADRPLTGYGWGAFWTGGGADFDVLLRSNFDVPHAHNAFVDAWLNAGVLAALLLLGIYVRGLFWATRNIRREPSFLGLFPAAIISLSVLFSLSETGFVGRTSSFILLIIGVLIAAENKGVVRPFLQKQREATIRQQAEALAGR